MCSNFESLLFVLKFITVVVICYFGKLGSKFNFSDPREFSGPATRDTRHAPIRLSHVALLTVCCYCLGLAN